MTTTSTTSSPSHETAEVPAVKPITAPFTIIVDSREQRPYLFDSIRGDSKQKYAPVSVPTMRVAIETGDYSIFGMPNVVVERKSKSDLYGSVVRRANFIGRLERMTELSERGGYAAILVECGDVDLLVPPRHCRLTAKSLNRTIIAWRQRYRADWFFISGRERSEQFCYRILERYYLDHKGKS